MELLNRLLVDHWGRREDHFNWRIDQEPLALDATEGVCLLHVNGKLGDGLFVSLLVDALAKVRPGLPIDLVCRESFAEYWGSHPSVRKVYTVDRRAKPRRRARLRHILAARQAARPLQDRFHTVVSFESYARPEHFAFLDGLAPCRLIGFGKAGFRRFDRTLHDGRYGSHLQPFATQVLSVLGAFGLAAPDDLRFHAPYGPSDVLKAEGILARATMSGPRLLFSVYGGIADKVMSPKSVANGVAHLRAAGHAGPIFLNAPAGQVDAYQAALCGEGLADGIVPLGPLDGLSALFALVAAMDGVVSVDSGVAHVAAALDRPELVVFARRNAVPYVWRPLNARCATVVPHQRETVDDIDWDEFGTAAKTLLGWMPAQD